MLKALVLTTSATEYAIVEITQRRIQNAGAALSIAACLHQKILVLKRAQHRAAVPGRDRSSRSLPISAVVGHGGDQKSGLEDHRNGRQT